MIPQRPGPGSSVTTTDTTPLAGAFNAETLSGQAVDFPGDFTGKLVLVDFWATWCGPCRAEKPYVAKAYEEYGDRGFEVLGVTLDEFQGVPASEVRSFVNQTKMPWQQVYKNAATIAQSYGVASIPAAFLVDADTRRIVAQGNDLRGAALLRTVAQHLKNRRG